MSNKPFSPACERNREPILAVLKQVFSERHHVLEIGSGTGQHAVHFAAAMPWLVWHCSDRPEYLPGVRQWLEEAALANTPAPRELDVSVGPWPERPHPPSGHHLPQAGDGNGKSDRSPGSRAAPQLVEVDGKRGRAPDTPSCSLAGEGSAKFDGAFSANTLHIMGWADVDAFFGGLGEVLADEATLVVYGPFNQGGRYSSDSNRQFDGMLRARDPRAGIRDLEAVDALARAIGLQLVENVAMPANNRCLVWVR